MPELIESFPSAKDTLAEPDLFARVLAPLAVIDTDGVTIPVVVPFEPMAGRLGERTRDVHTVFASRDHIGFRLGDDGRLDFLGDPLYFELFSRAQTGATSRSLTAFYEDQYAGLSHVRRRGLLPPDTLTFADPDLDWLDALDPDGDPEIEPVLAQEFMPNGGEFTKIASINPQLVLPRSAGTWTLWFEERSATVLLTRAD